MLLMFAAWKVWLSGSAQDKRCAEAFGIIAIGSLLPAVLLDIAGGSAYYFANVGTWACIVFVSAYGVPAVAARRPGLLKLAVVVPAVVLVALATGEKRNSVRNVAAQFRDLEARARLLTGKDATPETTASELLALLVPGHRARRELAADVSRTPGAQARQTLLSLGLTQDRHAAVFVPPENQAFWSTYEDCRGDPFFVPAILGAPMLKGLNPAASKCVRDVYYTFTAYAADAASQATGDAELCNRANRLGFDTVIILATPAAGRRLACGDNRSRPQ
jgi:hypothetical protein